MVEFLNAHVAQGAVLWTSWFEEITGFAGSLRRENQIVVFEPPKRHFVGGFGDVAWISNASFVVAIVARKHQHCACGFVNLAYI